MGNTRTRAKIVGLSRFGCKCFSRILSGWVLKKFEISGFVGYYSWVTKLLVTKVIIKKLLKLSKYDQDSKKYHHKYTCVLPRYFLYLLTVH